MEMTLDNTAKYFKENQTEVVRWWNPETGLEHDIYAEGLINLITELKRRRVERILDAACGKGRATKELSKFFRVTAVDISAEMLRIVDSLKLNNVETEESNVETLPFEDSSFDAVVFLATAVHMENLSKVFSEFYRVLMPGGVLIFDIDNKRGAIRMLKNLIEPVLYRLDNDYRRERINRFKIYQPILSRRAKELATHAGFKIESKYYLGTIMPFRIKNVTVISQDTFGFLHKLVRFIDKFPFINKFATYIYFICTKEKA